MNPSLKLNESMELPYMFKNNILNIRKFITSERLKESFKLHVIVHSVSIYWMPSMWEGNGTPLQYSCLENPMDGGAWWAAVHGVTQSRTRLSNFTFTFHFHALEKEMATHSSVLAWRIPGKGDPGGLPSMGSHRVGHDWSNLACDKQFDSYLYKIYKYLCSHGNINFNIDLTIHYISIIFNSFSYICPFSIT